MKVLDLTPQLDAALGQIMDAALKSGGLTLIQQIRVIQDAVMAAPEKQEGTTNRIGAVPGDAEILPPAMNGG